MSTESGEGDGAANAAPAVTNGVGENGAAQQAPDSQQLETLLKRSLPALGPDQRETILKMIALNTSQSYTGPIPPPEMLKAYANVNSQLPDKLVDAWLDESNHRREMERREHDLREKEHGLQDKALTLNSALLDKGYNHSLWIVLALIVTGTFLGYLGHAWLASVALGGTVIGVLSVHILKRLPQRPLGSDDDDPTG